MRNTTTGFGEIQGLRAIAVLAVLIFHVWALALPGGFIGVDVFFVISGFVITNSLYAQIRSTGRISIADFYSRRVRRLIPASATVLVATFVACYFLLPPNRWNDTISELLASALFVENWLLVANSVDYLASKNAASPVQHYWSLSIEEQFYFVWPVAMAAAVRFSGWMKWPLAKILFGGMAAVFISSLCASWLYTNMNADAAYFLTQTRIWELALGGLVAIGIYGREFNRGTKRIMSAAGMVMIVYAALTYSSSTAFPGLAALIPTVGAALIIAARDLDLPSFSPLNNTLLTRIGDRSYSLYLWHWPVIVIYKAHYETVGIAAGLLIFAFVAVLSEISYRFIENRYRKPSAAAERRPIYFAAGGFAASLACAVLFYGWNQYHTITIPASETWEYPGPSTLLSGIATPANVEYFPSLAQLQRDVPSIYRLNCHQNKTEDEAIDCSFGNSSSDRLIVLVGDSVAAQWAPALEKIATQGGFKLITITKAACPYSRVKVKLSGRDYPSCMRWRDDMVAEIAQMKPAMIFASQAGNYTDVSDADMENGFRSIWRDFLATGAKLYVIESTPLLPSEPADCIARNSAPCVYPRSEVAGSKALLTAARSVPAVDYIDMTDGICLKSFCSVIVGNVIAWRDSVHLSATYAGLLSSYLKTAAGL